MKATKSNRYITAMLKAGIRAEEARIDWEHRWPRHCPHCGGWGYLSGPGCSVPYGSTWVSLPQETDPCSHCVEEGKCPRCGHQLDGDFENEGDARCPSCGWVDGETEGLPDSDY